MPGYRLDNLKTIARAAADVSATGAVGAGAHGVVTVTVVAAGPAGNLYTMETVNGVGNDVPLSADLAGTVLTVTLATDSGGSPDDTANTATLVAAAIDALDEFSAVASGNGSTVVPEDTSTFTGGVLSLSIGEIARRSTCSDWLIRQLLVGGNCMPHEADRIAAALGTNLTGLGAAAL